MYSISKETLGYFYNSAKEINSLESFVKLYKTHTEYAHSISDLRNYYPEYMSMYYSNDVDLSVPPIHFFYFIFHNNLENYSRNEIITLWKLQNG
jgi:hypothetical protein